MALSIFNPPDDERTKSGGPRATPSLTAPAAAAPPSAGAGGQVRGVSGAGTGGPVLTPGAPPPTAAGTPPLTPPSSFGQRVGEAYTDYGPAGGAFQAVKEFGQGADDLINTGKQVVGSVVKGVGQAVAPALLGTKGAAHVGLAPPPAPIGEGQMSTEQLKSAYAASPLPPAIPQEQEIPGGGVGPAGPPLTQAPQQMGPQLPGGVSAQTMPDGTDIYGRLTRPEGIPQLGLAQYSNTPFGATAQGINSPLGARGEPMEGGREKGVNGITFGQTPDRTTKEGRAEYATGKKTGDKKTTTSTSATTKPLTQPTKSKPGGQQHTGAVDPFTKRKLSREMRMEIGGLTDDMKRGRISAKQAAVLAPLIKMKYAKLFGLDPKDATEANSKNRRTDAQAGSEQLRQASETERQAMDSAARVEAAGKKNQPLARPFKPVTLTDTDGLTGNKTQRIVTYDPNIGGVVEKGKTLEQRWVTPTHEEFTWTGPEGGDRNDTNNWEPK